MPILCCCELVCCPGIFLFSFAAFLPATNLFCHLLLLIDMSSIVTIKPSNTVVNLFHFLLLQLLLWLLLAAVIAAVVAVVVSFAIAVSAVLKVLFRKSLTKTIQC